MDVILDPGHLLELVPGRHVVVNQTHAPMLCHGNGHTGFGHGIHVGGQDGKMELDPFSQAGFQLGFPWEDVGVKRAETQVVVGQPTILVGRKEVVCLEKKVLVENVWLLRVCHVKVSQSSLGLARWNLTIFEGTLMTFIRIRGFPKPEPIAKVLQGRNRDMIHW